MTHEANPILQAFANAQGQKNPLASCRQDTPAWLYYLILFTPRSGSSWLCSMLSATHRLGHPDEWFNLDTLAAQAATNEADSPQAYAALLHRKYKTANGVFGQKINAHQLRFLGQTGGIRTVCGHNLRHILLTRRDFVLQAVSLELAVRTGRFHALQGTDNLEMATGMDYDHDRLAEMILEIMQQEYEFTAYCQQLPTPPLHLEYETIVAGPEACLQAVAAYLGVPLWLEVDDVFVPYRRLRQTINTAFAERFRQERPEFVTYWEGHRGRVAVADGMPA